MNTSNRNNIDFIIGDNQNYLIRNNISELNELELYHCVDTKKFYSLYDFSVIGNGGMLKTNNN